MHQRMALSSFQLCLSQVSTAPEVLKVRVLPIIFDILMVHKQVFLGVDNPNAEKIVGSCSSCSRGNLAPIRGIHCPLAYATFILSAAARCSS